MISQASIEDIPEIRDVAEETWPVSYREIISPEQIRYMLDWMYAPEMLERDIRGGQVTFLKLEVCERMAGFAAFDREFLHKLYIRPDEQRKGYGSMLLCAVVEEHIDGEVLRLRVNRNNHPAIKTYEKAGFEIESEVCSDIGGGFVMDDYQMIRHLK